MWPDVGDPESVEYLVLWQPPPDLLENFPNAKVLFSVAAGIDHLGLREPTAGFAARPHGRAGHYADHG